MTEQCNVCNEWINDWDSPNDAKRCPSCINHINEIINADTEEKSIRILKLLQRHHAELYM